MKKKYMAVLMSAIALGLAACGSGAVKTTAEQTTAEVNAVETTAAQETETAAAKASETATETIEEQETLEETVTAEEPSSESNDAADEKGEAAPDESKQGGMNGGFGGPGGQGSPGGNGNHGGMNGGQGGPGGNSKASDTELQAMIADVAPKFELMTFEDEESGTSLQYQLYIPEDYDPSQSYPLLQFIPDSSVVGRDADAVLTQGWGGLIWATEEEQAKHPSFIVIPVFTETVVNDNAEHSDQIDVAVRLLRYLTKEYSIDTDRIYTTGQSMGGMTSFYLNIAYPDLFAASLFVGSQWDNSQLSILEDRDFFYIVAAGDPRASEGQAGLLEVFDADGAAYTHEVWSAQDPADTQNAAVEEMLSEGNCANFVTFTEGSTLAEGSSTNSMMGEHMTSFDYAYKIEAVRDWLYRQSK